MSQPPAWSPLGYAGRDGDTISLAAPPLFGDATGRPASRDDLPVHYRLTRNGTEIGTADGPYADFPVPAAKATYRLEATVTAALRTPCRRRSRWPGPSPRRTRPRRSRCP
ncbi:hypothetical protein GCM10027614_18700 [Micromonospora vulcania]